MGEFVCNMLNFARTQLDGGIALHRQDVELEPVPLQVIGELQAEYL